MIPESPKAFAGRKALQRFRRPAETGGAGAALMCGTRLLLLDEPFEGVAPVLAHRLAEVIAGLKSQGLSVILTESDLSHSQEILDVGLQHRSRRGFDPNIAGLEPRIRAASSSLVSAHCRESS